MPQSNELPAPHPDARAYREAVIKNLGINDITHLYVDRHTAVDVNSNGSGAFVQVWVWVDANDTNLPLCPGCREYRLPKEKQYCETCLPPEVIEHITNMTRAELEAAHFKAHGVDCLDGVGLDELRQLLMAAFASDDIEEQDIGLPRRKR